MGTFEFPDEQKKSLLAFLGRIRFDSEFNAEFKADEFDALAACGFETSQARIDELMRMTPEQKKALAQTFIDGDRDLSATEVTEMLFCLGHLVHDPNDAATASALWGVAGDVVADELRKASGTRVFW